MPILLILLTLIFMWVVFQRKRSHYDYYSPLDMDDFERKRMRVYTQDLEGIHFPLTISDQIAEEKLISFNPKHSKFFINHPKLLEQGNSETIYDLNQIHERFIVDTGKLVLIETWADAIDWYTVPTIAKARHIFAKTVKRKFCTLLRLRSRVHFGPIRSDPLEFDQKKNILIWRGGPSGTGFHNKYESRLFKPSREEALRRWALNPETQTELDLGLTEKWQYQDFQKYIKPEKTITDMLQYKYILSIEGNDVATNLKWAMASNSVVLMPQPHVESWFAESLLKPYVHYVPVRNDFSDLYTQKKWCDAHPEKCKEIIRNAQAFVQPFRNHERDYYLCFKVLQRYLHCVNFVTTVKDIEKQKKLN